jgi:hypothetical protein
MRPRDVNNAIRTMMAQIATGIDNSEFGGVPQFHPATAAGPASLDFAEDTDNGTNKVTLKAPASIAADVDVILPGTADTLVGRATTDTLTNKTLTSPIITTDITIPNTGLHILDTNASHDLIVKPGSNITADRTLTITTGDTDIEIDLTDPGADRIMFWDDSAGKWIPLTLGTNLTITGTTLNAAGGSGQPVPTSSTFAVDTLLLCSNQSGSGVADGATTAGSGLRCGTSAGGALTGTWKCVHGATVNTSALGYFVRTA